MRKIIFLDIDGVLATPEYVVRGMWGLNPSKQELLGKILQATDAEIVLSSSWRKNSLQETKEHMEKKGFLFVDKIVGVTIRAYQYLERGTGIHLSIPRGVEIKQWIDTNIHSQKGKNYKKKKIGKTWNYIILDDDVDMLLEQKSNFIQTHWKSGLSEQDVEKAISILNFTKIPN